MVLVFNHMKEFNREFLELIIQPTLKELKMHSPEAENLILGTALAETALREMEQGWGKKQGTALGFFQMEPNTHDDIWKNYLAYRPEIINKIQTVCNVWGERTEGLLIWNLRYACAMARIKYYPIPHYIPDSVKGQAEYWKKWYNTNLGAGTVQHYLDAWERK